MKDGSDIKNPSREEKGMLSKLLSSDRAVSIIIIAGLAGIALIFLSNALKPRESADSSAQSTESITASLPEDYRAEITEELGNMLASMDGVGRTKVMVTIDKTQQNIYATDTDHNGRETTRTNGTDENADKQNTEKRSCIIVRKKDGSEQALTVGQLMPQIKGVLIICDGGDNEDVRQRIVDAVSAALDINKTHICVSKLAQ